MFRHRRLFLLGPASVALFLACTGNEPLLVAGPDDHDAAVAPSVGSDATTAVTGDAAINATDAAGELIENSDFSTGTCEPWNNGGTSILNIEKVTYDGLFACRACAVNDAGVYGVNQGIVIKNLPQPAAGVYEGNALVRLLPDDAGVPASTSVVIGTFVDKDEQTLYGDSTPFVGVTSKTWTRATRQITYDGGSDAVYLELNVLNRRDDKGCFLVTGLSFKKIR